MQSTATAYGEEMHNILNRTLCKEIKSTLEDNFFEILQAFLNLSPWPCTELTASTLTKSCLQIFILITAQYNIIIYNLLLIYYCCY